MNTTVNADTSSETPKLTRAEKLHAKLESLRNRINADTEKFNEIAAELNNIAALAAIGVGSVVVVKLGRKFSEEKDTTRFVTATVTGVKEDEDGAKQYKVMYGEGFDAEIAVVSGGQLSLPPAVAEVAPETAGSEQV